MHFRMSRGSDYLKCRQCNTLVGQKCSAQLALLKAAEGRRWLSEWQNGSLLTGRTVWVDSWVSGPSGSLCSQASTIDLWCSKLIVCCLHTWDHYSKHSSVLPRQDQSTGKLTSSTAPTAKCLYVYIFLFSPFPNMYSVLSRKEYKYFWTTRKGKWNHQRQKKMLDIHSYELRKEIIMYSLFISFLKRQIFLEYLDY